MSHFHKTVPMNYAKKFTFVMQCQKPSTEKQDALVASSSAPHDRHLLQSYEPRMLSKQLADAAIWYLPGLRSCHRVSRVATEANSLILTYSGVAVGSKSLALTGSPMLPSSPTVWYLPVIQGCRRVQQSGTYRVSKVAVNSKSLVLSGYPRLPLSPTVWYFPGIQGCR